LNGGEILDIGKANPPGNRLNPLEAISADPYVSAIWVFGIESVTIMTAF
jgi:hypothetical protein